MNHFSTIIVVKMTYPSKGKLFILEASSSALVQVGPGEGFASLFVPSHWWSPPDGVVTLWPLVKTVPSKIVFVAPSIRKLTRVGTFAAVSDESKNSTDNNVKLENNRRNIILHWHCNRKVVDIVERKFSELLSSNLMNIS